ncbi:hypothetical protein, partial [Pseudomonas sp.]|uniref:hypothetical protein n=1 Tax=Pseudomonas sp. TaxID=306 RepID=UPI0025859A71
APGDISGSGWGFTSRGILNEVTAKPSSVKGQKNATQLGIPSEKPNDVPLGTLFCKKNSICIIRVIRHGKLECPLVFKYL